MFRQKAWLLATLFFAFLIDSYRIEGKIECISCYTIIKFIKGENHDGTL
jgi:hypothetical protein